MSALFPNVPTGAGIPPVFRQALGGVNNAVLLLSDIKLLTRQKPQWGVYFANGQKALDPDSVLSFGVRGDWRVADYPIEEGGFGTYDKVRIPALVRMRMSKGGTDQDRKRFLDAVFKLANSVEIVALVIPETRQLGWNLEHYDYERRSDRGVWLLDVDLYFRRVISVPIQSFQSTAQPADASPVQTGTAQPVAPSAQPGAFASIGSALQSVGTSIVDLAGRLGNLAISGLSEVAGALGISGAGMIEAAGPIGAAVSSTPGIASTLFNTGMLVSSTTPLLDRAQTLITGTDVESIYRPELANGSLATALLSQNILNAHDVLSGGGTVDQGLFPFPTIRSATQVSTRLDVDPTPVQSSGITFGPVFPYAVQ